MLGVLMISLWDGSCKSGDPDSFARYDSSILLLPEVRICKDRKQEGGAGRLKRMEVERKGDL